MTSVGSILDLEIQTSMTSALCHPYPLSSLTRRPGPQCLASSKHLQAAQNPGATATTSVRNPPQQESKCPLGKSHTLPCGETSLSVVSFFDPELISNKRAPDLGYSFRQHYSFEQMAGTDKGGISALVGLWPGNELTA